MVIMLVWIFVGWVVWVGWLVCIVVNMVMVSRLV